MEQLQPQVIRITLNETIGSKLDEIFKLFNCQTLEFLSSKSEFIFKWSVKIEP